MTWEWTSDHAKRDDKVAAVLNSRLSQSRVKDLVQFLYLTEYYTVSEKIAVAVRKKYNPPCTVEEIGTRHEPVISCGHHPFLLARLVNDLTVESDPNGGDMAVTWKARPSGRHKSIKLR